MGCKNGVVSPSSNGLMKCQMKSDSKLVFDCQGNNVCKITTASKCKANIEGGVWQNHGMQAWCGCYLQAMALWHARCGPMRSWFLGVSGRIIMFAEAQQQNWNVRQNRGRGVKNHGMQAWCVCSLQAMALWNARCGLIRSWFLIARVIMFAKSKQHVNVRLI